MPVRYIFAATRMHRYRNSTQMAIESSNCHSGTPPGSRTIMAIGDVNGIIESQNVRLPPGLADM